MSWRVRTNCEERICLNLLSPLAQGRELKCERLLADCAMIESPLAQGRELKSYGLRNHARHRLSPLAQGRELKSALWKLAQKSNHVAPRAGAGIEIFPSSHNPT